MATKLENLLLSHIAYLNINDTDKETSLSKLIENYSDKYTTYIDSYALQNDETVKSVLENWKVYSVENNLSDTGFYGIAYQNTKTLEVVVAYRGTEGQNTLDLLNDGAIGAGSLTRELKALSVLIPKNSETLAKATNVFEEVIKVIKGKTCDIPKLSEGMQGMISLSEQIVNGKNFYEKIKISGIKASNITLAGHSLGGGIANAVMASTFIDKIGNLKEVPKESVTFNSPGMYEYIYNSFLPILSWTDSFNNNLIIKLFKYFYKDFDWVYDLPEEVVMSMFNGLNITNYSHSKDGTGNALRNIGKNITIDNGKPPSRIEALSILINVDVHKDSPYHMFDVFYPYINEKTGNVEKELTTNYLKSIVKRLLDDNDKIIEKEKIEMVTSWYKNRDISAIKEDLKKLLSNMGEYKKDSDGDYQHDRMRLMDEIKERFDNLKSEDLDRWVFFADSDKNGGYDAADILFSDRVLEFYNYFDHKDRGHEYFEKFNKKSNIILGNNKNNNILAGDGDDTIYGDSGNDTLDGGEGTDTLLGGKGTDFYLFSSLIPQDSSVTSEQDIINDEDGKGAVVIDEIALSEIFKKDANTANTYTYSGDTSIKAVLDAVNKMLTISYKNNHSIVIKDYTAQTNGRVGIWLEEKGINVALKAKQHWEAIAKTTGLRISNYQQNGNSATTTYSLGGATFKIISKVCTGTDPLILDLDGNGIKTLSAFQNIAFDLNNDGEQEKTSWAAPGEGILTLDKNGDGQITSGAELFGDRSIKKDGSTAAEGFDALKDYDDNKDGKIDSSDAVYSQIRVWNDLNSNGLSDTGELSTLNETGIASINLNSETAGFVDENNSIEAARGTYTKTTGVNGIISEYQLARQEIESVTIQINGVFTSIV